MSRRRRCASIAEAAARIEALEDAVATLTARVAVLETRPDPLPDLAALTKRVRVLETAQPFQVVR